MCFLKGKGNLVATIRRENPVLADWWIEEEQKAAIRKNWNKPQNATFCSYQTFSDLKEIAMQPTLPIFDNNPEGVDCFCTD